MKTYKFATYHETGVDMCSGTYYEISEDGYVVDIVKLDYIKCSRIVSTINEFLEKRGKQKFKPKYSGPIRELGEEVAKFFMALHASYNTIVMYEEKPPSEAVKKALVRATRYAFEGLPPREVRLFTELADGTEVLSYGLWIGECECDEIFDLWKEKYKPNISMRIIGDTYRLKPEDFRSLILCEFLVSCYILLNDLLSLYGGIECHTYCKLVELLM
ncbi:hypothetical protein DRP04_03930 [Archaeoglobales archaeon]|nr:MAG: hypothetical protein DRP04_03930 [Archaeoglobales archaeon]